MATPAQLFACSIGAVYAADLVCTPFQGAKVRLQGASGHGRGQLAGFAATLRDTARAGGIRALWSGFIPGLVRQTMYGGVRIGLYRVVLEGSDSRDASSVAPWQRVGVGVLTGGVAALFANPPDVVMVRIQAEAHLPLAERKHGGGIVRAFSAVYQSGGLAAFYRGWSPTMTRAMIGTGTSLAVYDVTKHALMARGFQDGMSTHLMCSFAAGVASAVMTLPVDAIKTRMYTHEPPHASAWAAVRHTVRHEGAMALYRGFIPHYLNVGPWLIVCFLTYEQLRRLIVGDR